MKRHVCVHNVYELFHYFASHTGPCRDRLCIDIVDMSTLALSALVYRRRLK